MPIKVGITGARGRSTIMGFRAIEDVEITAICDLDEQLLDKMADEYNIKNKYRVFDDMLESDIDAVVIATPMQCHVPQAIAALEAGKHVMSEVTAGVTMDELWWLVESVEKSGRIYMMAENYMYIPALQLVNTLVEKGFFGETYFGEGEYLHDVSELMTYQNGKASWRRYWQFGKRGAFYPTHSLGPAMQWFKGSHIREIACHTAKWFTNKNYKLDDNTMTMCHLDNGKLVKIRVDCKSPRPHKMDYYSLQGTKGCFESGRGMGDADKIWLEDFHGGTHREWHPLSDFNEYLPDRYKNATEAQNKSGHGGGDFFIVEDFYNAVTGKTPSPVDVYDACEWTAVALLSELSAMNNARIMTMPEFRKNLTHADRVIKL